MWRMTQNLLGGPEPTLLPENDEAKKLLDDGVEPKEVAARFPSYCLAWARLSEKEFRNGYVIRAYAYARTGYHRGLDQLRRNGWKGHGPIPWEHEGNQGFLRSLNSLARAAAAIGEDDEAERCRTFLRDSSPTAADELAG
jgi:hypothetical protein